MFVYRVCKMTYGSWGNLHYGDTIKTFDSEQKAMEWCQEKGLSNAWDGIGIETLEVN